MRIFAAVKAALGAAREAWRAGVSVPGETLTVSVSADGSLYEARYVPAGRGGMTFGDWLSARLVIADKARYAIGREFSGTYGFDVPTVWGMGTRLVRTDTDADQSVGNVAAVVFSWSPL